MSPVRREAGVGLGPSGARGVRTLPERRGLGPAGARGVRILTGRDSRRTSSALAPRAPARPAPRPAVPRDPRRPPRAPRPSPARSLRAPRSRRRLARPGIGLGSALTARPARPLRRGGPARHRPGADLTRGPSALYLHHLLCLRDVAKKLPLSGARPPPLGDRDPWGPTRGALDPEERHKGGGDRPWEEVRPWSGGSVRGPRPSGGRQWWVAATSTRGGGARS